MPGRVVARQSTSEGSHQAFCCAIEGGTCPIPIGLPKPFGRRHERRARLPRRALSASITMQPPDRLIILHGHWSGGRWLRLYDLFRNPPR
jgi:hypothetical protein